DIADVFCQSKCRGDFREFRGLKVHKAQTVPRSGPGYFFSKNEQSRKGNHGKYVKNTGKTFEKFRNYGKHDDNQHQAEPYPKSLFCIDLTEIKKAFRTFAQGCRINIDPTKSDQ